MSSQSIYKSIETAKNGSQIPVFQSGRTMESRYNPERDAENLCTSITDESFFVITGIGSGIFLEKLSQKFPHSKIIAVEKEQSDIDFLFQLDSIKKLSKNLNIFFSTLENLFTTLTQNYLPAKYGDLKIIEHRGWVNENPQSTAAIKAILEKSLSIISADYSVQAHFGRLWTHNIINNASLIQKTSKGSDAIERIKTSAKSGKTAIIVAAGPSLDSYISQIKNEKEKQGAFIIATDTAWSSLIANQISADAVVSIDGQSVSYNHFVHKTSNKSFEKSSKAPLFFFDLCSNTSAAQHVIDSGFNTVFFSSGHPLSMAIKNFSHNAIPFLFSGSGTVTITAADFAVKAGFEKIKIYGADFSYSSGKSYTKGTYLDTLYNLSSSKKQTSEETFSHLMYRTELIPLSENHKTTQVLKAYRSSLESYMQNNNISFKREDFVYELDAAGAVTFADAGELYYQPSNFDMKSFISEIKKSSPGEIETLLLPYVAYLRNLSAYKDKDYNELLQLAFSKIVSYNI